MKISPYYEPDRIVAKGKDANPNLTDPYLDAAAERILATNGHMAVSVPVDRDASDRNQYLSRNLLKVARRFSQDGAPVTIEGDQVEPDGPTWPCEQDRKFPDISAVLASAPHRGVEGTFTVGLNAKNLRDLAVALGSDGAVRLTFDLANPESPIRVERYAGSGDELGVLMPMKAE